MYLVDGFFIDKDCLIDLIMSIYIYGFVSGLSISLV